MSARAERAHRVREALVLRDAVLRYLSPARDGRETERLRAATPAAWSFLVRYECCALPLVTRLRADGVLNRLDASVQECLASAAATELQRVLAARLLVRELDTIGGRSGV